ncbi:MAG: hypothetical protein RR956_02760 [Christensenella sp.]
MTEIKLGKRSFWEIVKQEHLILIALVFLFYYTWCVLLPEAVAPDEYMRYQVPEFIYNNGYLPHGAEPAIRDVNWGISCAFSPYLAQLIGLGFMKIAGLFTTDPFAMLMAVRMVSVLSATATVWVCIKISQQLFASSVARALFVVLVAALPQFIYLATYVNNDSFAIFTTSVILYAWVIGLKNKWPMKSCVLLGIGMGICAMSYYNAYGWLLTSVILFFVSALIMDKARWRDKKFRIKIYVVVGIFAAITAWWFIRSYIIYDGDFLGLNITEKYKEMYALDYLKPSNAGSVQQSGASLWHMLFDMGWARTSYFSAIGVFGSLNVFLPLWIYVVYSVMFLVAFIGCIMRLVAFIKEKSADKPKKCLAGICMIITIVIPIALSIYYSYTSDFQAQGRYILPMLLSFMVFVTVGLKTFFGRILPKKAADAALAVIAILLILITIYCFAGVYIPSYR